MSEQPPSIWGMDRAAIEQTLVEGRSPRREYTEDDKIAIRAVLDQPDFDEMAEEKRATAFQRMHNVIAGRNEQPSMTSGSSSMAITGWIVLVISVVLMVYAAFGYDTAIPSDSNFFGDTFIPSRYKIKHGDRKSRSL